MAYGILKCDTVTFTNDGVDKSVSISGLVQNPTFSGNVTVTGTLSGVTVTGTTANFVSGVFSSQISGTTVTGTTASFTSGVFANISGGTHTVTSGVFAAGSEASPSISFTSDSDTGLYSPGADQLALSTNGTGRLFVNSLGNVGVGSSPVSIGSNISTIHAKGAAGGGIAFGSTSFDQSLALFTSGDGVAGNLGTYANMPLVLTTNSTERARIDSSGRLLVGTSSDSGGALLQVNGDRIRIATAKTPASATDTGTAGEVCWDANYVYVCTATNTWKRSALSTW